MADRRRVLITGAAGYIGTFLRKGWEGEYAMVLVDNKDISDPGQSEVVIGDIADLERMRRACQGVDTLIHLAADPSPRGEFDKTVLPVNIIGTHNTFRAASEAGVRRTVFASSIHAVGAYLPDVQVKEDMPVRPCCEYGTSKCYGEALGSYFADVKGMSVIAIRIGGVHGHHGDELHHQPSAIDYLVSEDDLAQLITKCVEAPDNVRFAIVHGISDNRFKRLDISRAREILGYEPDDDAAEGIGQDVPEPHPIHSAV